MTKLRSQHGRVGLGCALLLFVAAFLISACTDTGPNGEIQTTWKINGTVTHNGISNSVDVYIEVFRNNEVFISGVVFVDDQRINVSGNGTYVGSFDPDSLEYPSLLRITTPLDQFQFQLQVEVPQPFTFEANGLTENQVFSNTMVSLEWTPAFPVGSEGGYIMLARQTSGSLTSVGYQETLNGAEGTIPTSAFRSLNDEFQPGRYNLWVIARSDQPVSWSGLPVTFDDSVFSENIERVGVSGQFGALYIPPPLEVEAVTSAPQ